MNISARTLSLAFLMCMGSIVQAQTYEQAKAAYDQKDYATALPWFTKLANAGDERAQFDLGEMNEFARGVPRNWNANNVNSEFWYRRAAEQGYVKGQYQLAYMYSRGLIPNKNNADAVIWFQQAAEQGDHGAMAELGRMYAQGRPGVQCNAAKAEMWYLKLSESGDSRSVLTPIGDMYAEGTCGQRDERQAIEWYRKGAEKGEALGQYKLGMAYFNGLGDLPKDLKQSAVWLRKSSDKGFILAQNQLGVFYANGQGVAKNDKQAVELFRNAAEQGWPQAQMNLGLMYEQGRSMPKDLQMAYYWWTIAGYDAEKERIRIEPTLSETQRITAQENARRFKPRER